MAAAALDGRPLASRGAMSRAIAPVDTRPFDPARHRLDPLMPARRTAVISIDIEPDYNGTATAALARHPEALSLLAGAGVPLTAFVEGRLLEARHPVVDALRASGADIQLHCYDHREAGDTPGTLARGVEAYARTLGAPPSGYRANTFRLSEPLLAALPAMGFQWDSSVLPGFGLGATRGWRLRDGAARIDGALVEFPLSVWRGTGLPLSQSYRNLIGPLAEKALRRLSPLPTLLVYDMHMVDLVRSLTSLAASPLPASVKAVMALCWRGRRDTSFASLADFIGFLKGRGFELTTLSALHARLTGAGWTGEPDAGGAQ